MIASIMRRGILVAMAKRDDIGIEEASFKAGIHPSTIYRFMSGEAEGPRITTLETFCKDGLGYDFLTVARFGKQP